MNGHLAPRSTIGDPALREVGDAGQHPGETRFVS
jgi:hypothetical protein